MLYIKINCIARAKTFWRTSGVKQKQINKLNRFWTTRCWAIRGGVCSYWGRHWAIAGCFGQIGH